MLLSFSHVLHSPGQPVVTGSHPSCQALFWSHRGSVDCSRSSPSHPSLLPLSYYLFVFAFAYLTAIICISADVPECSQWKHIVSPVVFSRSLATRWLRDVVIIYTYSNTDYVQYDCERERVNERISRVCIFVTLRAVNYTRCVFAIPD